MTLTAVIVRTCIRLGIPRMLENPVSSMMWRAPPIAHSHLSSFCSSHIFDQCQFGTRWRNKKTRALTWHCGDCDVLNKQCSGRKGMCSLTCTPHIVLQGNCKDTNTLWTKIAQEYPVQLSRHVAAELSCAAEAVKLRVSFRISGLTAK